MYTVYAEDVSVLVTSSTEMVKVSKEIRRYKVMTGARINHENWWVCSWICRRTVLFQGPFRWMDRACKISLSPAGKNWLEVLEKVITTPDLWLRRSLSLKGHAKVYGMHIYHWYFTVCQYFLSYASSYSIWKGSCTSLSGPNGPLWKISQLYISEDTLGGPNIEICHHILHLSFLGQMCTQDDKTDDFWKEDTREVFPLLINMHSNNGEAHHMLPYIMNVGML